MRSILPGLVHVIALATLPAAAHALTLQAQGRLSANGGGPVADGFYAAKFKLYTAQDAKAPVWDETWLGLDVKQGLFAAELGTQELVKNPLPEAVFTDNAELWLAVQISVEPELARVRLAPVPYAVRAAFADKLLGTLSGTQIADNSLPAKAAGFSYAASDSKGGAATGLQCTGCIELGELAPGVLDAKNVAWANSTVHEGLDGLAAAGTKTAAVADKAAAGVALVQSGVTVANGAVGLGKTPADKCGVDFASTSGSLCVDGAPATVMLEAASAAVMDKLQKPGQLVLRTDTNQVFVFVGSGWRLLQFAAVCGDGAVDSPETCDDKNGDDTDACAKCHLAKCGDGFVLKGKEACDDGNGDPSDACVQCKSAACGDGELQTGVEVCDGAKLGDATCQTIFGQTASGKLACAGDCKKLDTTPCVVPLGTDTNPATSCKAILVAQPGMPSGAYWLKVGADKQKAYCDMTTASGGWTLGVSWNYSTTPAQWGSFAAAVADPKPGVKHALPFVTVPPAPVEFRAVYQNGQVFAGTFSGGWEKSGGKGVRIKLTNGDYLIFDHQGCGGGVDTSEGYGICMVNGNYSDGYSCDGNSGQVSGTGLFNRCAGDENGCSNPSWVVAGSVQVCNAKELLAVYFR